MKEDQIRELELKALTEYDEYARRRIDEAARVVGKDQATRYACVMLLTELLKRSVPNSFEIVNQCRKHEKDNGAT